MKSIISFKKIHLVLLTAFSLLANEVNASSLTLECKNIRRPYNLIFNSKDNTLIARTQTEVDVLYPIHRILETKDGFIVWGKATDNGPYFELVIGKKSEISFTVSMDQKQTDSCRKL